MISEGAERAKKGQHPEATFMSTVALNLLGENSFLDTT